MFQQTGLDKTTECKFAITKEYKKSRDCEILLNIWKANKITNKMLQSQIWTE